MKKILPILLTSSLLAGAASGISPVDLAKLEGLVKKDPNVMKGNVNMNGRYSDAYRLTIGGVNYDFNDFHVKISYLDGDSKVTFYDFDKDGSPEGVSMVETGRPRIFEVAEIASGDLEDVKFALDFSGMRRRLNNYLGEDMPEDNIHGIHPDGDVVSVNFSDGELLKDKNEGLKKVIVDGYDSFVDNLREYLKPAKDSGYKGR